MLMKKVIGLVLKIFVYCGLAVAVLYIGDFLSLMDLEMYHRTGEMSLLLKISNSPFIFVVILGLPLIIVSNMRLWKKFE